jgi:aspartate racemase
MSWESTSLYYSKLNQLFNRKLGGVHSAPVLIDSLEFHTIRQLQITENWSAAGRLLGEHARRLQDAGAEIIAMAVNTMHRVADAVEAAVSVPFVDIRACAVSALNRQGLKRPLLLGGSVVLQEDGFYVRYLKKHGIEVILPTPDERIKLDQIIFEEFPRQIFSDRAREYCYSIINRSVTARGSDSVILACTELPILFSPNIDENNGPRKSSIPIGAIQVPIVDTVLSHVEALASISLGRISNVEVATTPLS